jgi:hypothetical protein
MKGILFVLYLMSANAFCMSFIVLLAKQKDQWTVPIAIGLTLIGGIGGVTAAALRDIYKRLDASKTMNHEPIEIKAEQAAPRNR